MKKSTKIIAGIVAVGIVGNLLGFGNDDESKKVEPVQAEVVQEPIKVEEPAPVEEKMDYKVQKTFIHDEPTTYSGKHVHEISIFGEFDLEDKKQTKKQAMEILNKEAEIGLEEQPTSEMVRVFVYQGKEIGDYTYLAVAVGTFDVIEGELELRDLQDKARYPIFNQLKNQ